MNDMLNFRLPTEEGAAYEKILKNLRTRSNKELEEQIRDAAGELETLGRKGLEIDFELSSKGLFDLTEKSSLSSGAVAFTQLLSGFSVAYKNDEFIGTELLPLALIEEGGMSAKYKIRDKAKDLNTPDDSIGTGGNVNEIDMGFTEGSIALAKRALGLSVDGWTIQKAADVVRRLMLVNNNVRATMDLIREKRIAAIITNSSNYGSNTVALTGTDKFSNSASDPIKTVDLAKASLWQGFGPSKLAIGMSDDVYRTLRIHPIIREGFLRGTYIGVKQLAQIFDVDEVFVGRARYNSSNEGASASYSRIWGTGNLSVLRVSSAPSEENVAFGYTFQDPEQVNTYFDQSKGGRGSQVIQVSRADAHVVTAADAGYLITGAV